MKQTDKAQAPLYIIAHFAHFFKSLKEKITTKSKTVFAG